MAWRPYRGLRSSRTACACNRPRRGADTVTVIFRNASPFALVPGGKPSVLFAEIVGDLTRPLLSLQSTVESLRDAARFSGEALEQPCVFLFLRHPHPRARWHR